MMANLNLHSSACPHRVAKQLLAPTGLRSKTPWGWGKNQNGKKRQLNP